MFEVFKPAPQRAIDVSDDYLQAVALGASRLGTNRVFELAETLLPRQLHPSLEVLTRKAKTAALVGFPNPVFNRMRLRPSWPAPLPPSSKTAAASPWLRHRNKVIRIPHHLASLLSHLLIQGVEK